MRILQVNAVYRTKSTGRIVMEMHKYFQSKGLESYVAYAAENKDTSGDPCVFQVGNILDHKLHALAYRVDKLQGCHSTIETLRFLRKIKKLKPDVVLTHNLHSNYLNVPLFLRGVKKQGIEIVMALHDCWFFTGGCYHYTASGCDKWKKGCKDCQKLGRAAAYKYKLNCKVFDEVHPTIVASSKWISEEAEKSLLSGRSDIHMIYDWVDSTTFHPTDGQHIRDKYGIVDSVMILGVATGWAPDKGQYEMIQLAKELPEAKIVLVGNQAYNAIYPDNVICIPFTDSKEELAELYSAADIFFNPSKQETFGLVSGEALSCGTPIIVYNTTACPEFVTENTGIVINDPGDILSAVKMQLERNSIVGRQRISEQCRSYALENFYIDNNIEQYISLFKDVIAK